MFPLLVSTTLVYLFPIPVRDTAQMDFPYVVRAASREEEEKKKEKQKAITSKCFLSVGVADGAAAAIVCNLTVTKNILTGFGKFYTKL